MKDKDIKILKKWFKFKKIKENDDYFEKYN